MLTGKIVRFDEVRGYGFIAPDDGGEDVFVHANTLLDEKHLFAPGLPVEFDVAESERGLKALSVRALRDKSAAPSLIRPTTPTTIRSSAERADDEDSLCDVLSTSAFRQEITEAFLAAAPSLTGAEIMQLRESMIALAVRHGWVEN